MNDTKEIKYSGCKGDNCKEIAYILQDIKYFRA